ncbi:ABC transporter substrate-binding protein [Necropsobacter rosorum]|uniref:ABC transporter substrate-binding protein n=1 Tax=Necropsobacter rosorum TaxID=908285 RepID=UPI000509EC5C
MWYRVKYCFITFLFSICTLISSANELVIGTTFSPEGIAHLLNEWNKQPGAFQVTTLNRTSSSLNQLLSSEKPNNVEVDLILSSSPMLFYNLQEKQRLAALPAALNRYDKQFVPSLLQNTTLAFALSGYGMLVNTALLAQRKISAPTSWQDLTDPNMQGMIMISSPTRSDTNHIIIEALLQKYGWQSGWELIHQIMANAGTVSSRSFGVVDKVRANIGAVGITIDNYAYLLKQKNTAHLTFQYFESFPVSPTFIAILNRSRKKEQAQKFIEFILSERGQMILNDGQMGKLPIRSLPDSSPNSNIQKYLLAQPKVDYNLLIKRQYLVKVLFEQQIIYRLNQLQENWKMLYQKERQLNRRLPELCKILTALPVSAEQSSESQYLDNFNPERELFHWQQFFINQQIEFIKAVEKL